MTAPLVLVAGSLHLDTVVQAPRLPGPDETLPGHAVDYLCGGKGGNQAVAAARHGAAAAFAGAVGEDAAGETLVGNLQAEGVGTSQVAVLTGAASGMSVAILDRAGTYGAVIVSGANLEIDAEAVEIPPSARVLVLQNEVPDTVNRALAARARASGVRVLFNAAPARPEAEKFPVDVLIVNRVEAAAMAGGQHVETVDDALAAAQKLSQGGCLALVTLGGEGLALAQPDFPPHHHPAVPVKVVSTHGAGDAFVGALAARLALGESIDRAVAYAQAAAALHVSLPPEGRGAIGPEMVEPLLAARA